MANDNNYWTQKRSDGRWETKKEGASRPSSVSDTQAEAWDKAKGWAKDSGGEAYLKGRDGRIRERSTYGKDPFPPKG